MRHLRRKEVRGVGLSSCRVTHNPRCSLASVCVRACVRAYVAGPDFDEYGDVLDVGEAFERLEMERVAAEDPDSLAYFNAQKKLHSTMKSTGGAKRVTKRT